MSRKRGGEVGRGSQKRVPSPSPDTVCVNKKTSTPIMSDRSNKTKTTNVNLVQDKTVHTLGTSTSYYSDCWNVFVQKKDDCIKFVGEDIIERVIRGNR